MYENKEVNVENITWNSIYRHQKLGYFTFVILEKCLCYISETNKQLTNLGVGMGRHELSEHSKAGFFMI